MIEKIKKLDKKLIMMFVVAISIAILVVEPHLFESFIKNANYEDISIIILYFPGIFLLVGLLEVLIPKKLVIKKLGKKSGTMGSIYSFFLGAILPGPLYISFPIAMIMARKGVSMFNVALFVGAWSCFKIGEEVLELQFLGPKFLLLRILITIPFVILSSVIISKAHINLKK